MNPRVTAVEYKSKHKLVVTFENSEKKQFDLSPYLHYPVFEPLKEESNCRNVKVYNGTVIWENNIDFDPDTLYLEGKTLG